MSSLPSSRSCDTRRLCAPAKAKSTFFAIPSSNTVRCSGRLMLEMIRCRSCSFFASTFTRERERKSACFWLSPSSTTLSPLTMRVSSASMIFVLGRTEPFIQGCTCCMRRCFSSRRVVQERDTCPNVCCAIGLLSFCPHADYTTVLMICEIVCFIPCDKNHKYNNGMELRQIRSFLSIAETLHFGRTADLIHLSQPALSLQIRALEEEVGVRLFERNRRKTTITAAGFAFRDDATAALLRIEQAVRSAQMAAAGKLGLLRIGFISTAGNEMVPDIVRGFRESNPQVEFSLRNILTT